MALPRQRELNTDSAILPEAAQCSHVPLVPPRRPKFLNGGGEGDETFRVAKPTTQLLILGKKNPERPKSRKDRRGSAESVLQHVLEERKGAGK